MCHSIRKSTILLFAAFSTGSCNGVDRHPPTMGADPPLTGAEGIAYTNQLQSALVTVRTNVIGRKDLLCEYTKPGHHEGESLPYQRYMERDKPQPTRYQCLRYQESPTADQIKSHLAAGFALTDLHCDIFFTRLSQHYNQRRFARGVVNDVGAAVAGALGLAKAGSIATGAAGVAFGLADSSFRNYDDAFLVAPELSTLQKKVYDEQDKFRTATLARKDIVEYADANSAILRYANTCTYVGMRSLVNASLAETTTPEKAMERMLNSLKMYWKYAKEMKGIDPAIDNAMDNVADNAAVGNGQ